MDVVRFIVDQVGGITGGMKIAYLAESFCMECAPTQNRSMGTRLRVVA